MCTKCGRKEAAIRLHYSGEALCVSCFLKRFEKRVIKGLKGTYQGPKNLKASGKAAGSKKKKIDKKKGVEKKSKPAGKRPNGAKRETPSRVVSQDGMAPLKRKKPTAE